MRSSDTLGELMPALVKAWKKIKNPAKTAINPHFKSKYAPLGPTLEDARKALLDQEIVLMQSCMGITRFQHISGEWIETDPFQLAEITDNPQKGASAVTYLRRYSLEAALAICGEEDQDGNEAPPRSSGNRELPRSTGAPGFITEKQAKFLYVLLKKKCEDPDTTRHAILEKAGVPSVEELPYDIGKKIIDDLNARPDRPDDDVNLDEVPF